MERPILRIGSWLGSYRKMSGRPASWGKAVVCSRSRTVWAASSMSAPQANSSTTSDTPARERDSSSDSPGTVARDSSMGREIWLSTSCGA